MHPIGTKSIEVAKLELDPENPRLPVAVQRHQDDMREYLTRETGMQELMASIGANGFFEGEALIACETPATKKEGVYRVVEGNRRLTALQLLLTPRLASRKSIQQVADEAEHRPDSVPVVIFKKREDILAYLGFRHITGVKNWDSLAKARYMAQLFDVKTDKKSEPVDRFRDVARMIGSRYDHVRKILIAYRLYSAIEQQDFFDIEELKEADFPLSVLHTAVNNYNSISNFIELKGEPISAGRGKLKFNNDRLNDLVEWLFKRDGTGKAKVPESRDLTKLAVIVTDSRALKSFREGATLEQAHRETYGVVLEFADHLHAAEDHLASANGVVATVADKIDEELREVANRIVKQATALQKMLRID